MVTFIKINFVLMIALMASKGLAKPVQVPKSLPEPKYMTTLGMVDGEVDGNITTVTIRLDKKPNWDAIPKIESHGNFLQVILPETIVPEPGKFFDGGSDLVPKIAVFQLTPNDAGIRLFINGDASVAQNVLKTSVVGRRIIISMDQTKIHVNKNSPNISRNAVKNPNRSEEPKNSPIQTTEIDDQLPDFIDGIARVESATSVIARTEVNRDLPPPALILKHEANSSVESKRSSEEKDNPNIHVEGKLSNDAVNPGERRADSAHPLDMNTKVQPDVVQKEPVRQASSLALGSNNGIDLRDKLVQITWFIGAMLAVLLLAVVFRSSIRRRFGGNSGQESLDMKMLSSLPLAPRQRLSLVQVGDERILIGVTPEHVSFIANLSKQTQTLGFGKILSHTEIEGADRNLTSTLPMAPAPRPKLKDIPGNDELSLGEVVVPRQNPIPKGQTDREVQPPLETRRKPASNRVNIAVGDDGARDVTPVKRSQGANKSKVATSRSADTKLASQESVDDVTKMIRDKLRQLKSI